MIAVREGISAKDDTLPHRILEEVLNGGRSDGVKIGEGNFQEMLKDYYQARGWDENAQVTVPQRTKEESSDYRYFPDPDLVPVTTTQEQVDAIRAGLGELPGETLSCVRVTGLGEFQLERIDAGGAQGLVCSFSGLSIGGLMSGDDGHGGRLGVRGVERAGGQGQGSEGAHPAGVAQGHHFEK